MTGVQCTSCSLSPAAGQKFLPSSAPTSGIAELAGSPGSMALSASPRSMTTLPPYASPQLPAYSSPRTSMSSRLAPDSYGNDIPMEAQWTKVRRSLLSLEVLDRAGLRYEARPVTVHDQDREYAQADGDRQCGKTCRYPHSGLNPLHRATW